MGERQSTWRQPTQIQESVFVLYLVENVLLNVILAIRPVQKKTLFEDIKYKNNVRIACCKEKKLPLGNEKKTDCVE